VPAPASTAGGGLPDGVGLAARTRPGSLTVVGIGIAAGVHLTAETRSALEEADEVLYVAADPISASWLQKLHPRSRSLNVHYEPGRPRERIYSAIAEEIVQAARDGRHVCAAFYGHPGFLARPAHEAIARARAEGIAARMLPAVSALDCLFADLGLDPADTGLQSYEATDFLVHGRRPDTSAALVLWQLSVIGKTRWSPEPDYGGLRLLVEHLLRWYPSEHEVTVYEASTFPGVASPRIERVPLGELAEEHITPMSTLYVPPSTPLAVDRAVVDRLWPEGGG
jgi:uncharacterized protein YabN with tetrapyrrole methylase and pyrophosphatase domain